LVDFFIIIDAGIPSVKQESTKASCGSVCKTCSSLRWGINSCHYHVLFSMLSFQRIDVCVCVCLYMFFNYYLVDKLFIDAFPCIKEQSD